MKIWIVISANEYDPSPLQSIKIHGTFSTYQDAVNKRKKTQQKYDKSTSLGWHVWIEESKLTQ